MKTAVSIGLLTSAALLSGLALQGCSPSSAPSAAPPADVPASAPAAAPAPAGKLVAIPPGVTGGGDCSIDSVDTAAPDPTNPKARVLLVRGWAAADAKGGVPSDDVFLSVKGPDGAMMIGANRLVRPDVAAALKQTTLVNSGFYVVADVSSMPGKLLLQVIQAKDGKYQLCARKPVIVQP